MIIERWGLPTWYHAEQVPAPVRAFAKSTLGCDYGEVVRLAGQLGYQPVTVPLPTVLQDTEGQAINNVWSLHLTMGEEAIPLMVRLVPPVSFHA